MESTTVMNGTLSSGGLAVIDAGPAPEALRVQEWTPADVNLATDPVVGDGFELDGGCPSAELLAAVYADNKSSGTEGGPTDIALDAGAAPF